MQIKTVTVLAASLALVHAGTWADDDKAPAATTPVAAATTEAYWGDVEDPVEGGKKTTTTTKPVVATTTTAPYWGDAEDPVEGGKKTTTTTTTTETYWGDVEDPVEGGKKTTTTTKPVVATTTTEAYWGDAEDPVEGGKKTTTTTTTTASYWGDIEQPVEGGKKTTTTTKPVVATTTTDHTWVDLPKKPAETTPVSGGKGGDSGCGVVIETVYNTVTVTVQPGKPTTPTPSPTPVKVQQWQDATTVVAAAKGNSYSGGYMAIVETWRSNMGLPDLSHDSTLESNAQDAADSSGGSLTHKLNSGSMAQVLAPGDSGNFESVFVGGWLCELPNLAGLGDSVCSAMTQGWNHGGQTGHAEILTSGSYSKIGCALGSGIWCCDLA